MTIADEQCCGTDCIPSELSCCPDGQWCADPDYVCHLCPSGLPCVTLGGIEYTSECCPRSGGCTDTSPSTGTGSPSSPTSTPSSIIPKPSSSPVTTASQSPTHTVQPSSTLTVTQPAQTTPPQQTTTPTHSFSHSTPTQISTQSSVGVVVLPSNTTSFVTSVTTPSSTHSPISSWNGSGLLLVGYCATAEFSLVYGPQTTDMYFIGIVGCMGDKTDCCPFQVATTTATVTATVTDQFFFPGVARPELAILPRCPEDYVTISSVCCPS